MAELQPTYVNVSGDGSATVVTWSDVPDGMACYPARLHDYPVKSLMVYGEFGGCSVEIEGSNDGAHWVSLRHANNLVISLVEENIVSIGQSTVLLKPRIVGGTSVRLTMSLLAVRAA